MKSWTDLIADCFDDDDEFAAFAAELSLLVELGGRYETLAAQSFVRANRLLLERGGADPTARAWLVAHAHFGTQARGPVPGLPRFVHPRFAFPDFVAL